MDETDDIPDDGEVFECFYCDAPLKVVGVDISTEITIDLELEALVAGPAEDADKQTQLELE